MLDIAVKTEAQGVSARFARVLDRLSRRLETLDYRVASSAVGAMESPEP
jgi:hypothetical protein